MMAKYDLTFDPPLMNAAGVLGFAPDPYSPFDLDKLGVFITNPISLRQRNPASGTRCLEYMGGILLHTGYPNPGLEAVIKHYGAHWDSSPLPVIVHLLAGDVNDIARMVARLEEMPGVAGFEIGLPPRCEPAAAAEFTHAALGELPVIIRLPFENATELAPALVDAGLAAVSLAPPRGSMIDQDGNLVHGRLFGPAIYPQALELLLRLLETGTAVIPSGGIYRQEQVDAMLVSGATAVQLDAVIWRGGY